MYWRARFVVEADSVVEEGGIGRRRRGDVL